MSFSFVRNDVRRRFDYLSLSPATRARTALRRRRARSYDLTHASSLSSADVTLSSSSSDVFLEAEEEVELMSDQRRQVSTSYVVPCTTYVPCTSYLGPHSCLVPLTSCPLSVLYMCFERVHCVSLLRTFLSLCLFVPLKISS